MRRGVTLSLQRSCTVVEEHTNLRGGGLRQLCIEARSRRVLLLDLEGSHAQATSHPSRLRKAVSHFDKIGAVVYVAPLSDLADPELVQKGGALFAAMVRGTLPARPASASASGPAQSAEPAGPLIFLLFTRADEIAALRTSDASANNAKLAEAADDGGVIDLARRGWLGGVGAATAESVTHLALCGHDVRRDPNRAPPRTPRPASRRGPRGAG